MFRNFLDANFIANGEPGDPGDIGRRGETGPSGFRGEQGLAGANGRSGARGKITFMNNYQNLRPDQKHIHS